MTPSPLELEAAAFASWPAFEQIDDGGWVMRFAEGYTKRANSANPQVSLDEGTDIEAPISRGEAFFRERGQPPIFRLVSFLEQWRLDARLAERGYHFLDPTLVLGRDLSPDFGENGVVASGRVPWLKTYEAVAGTGPHPHPAHARILERLDLAEPAPLFASLRQGGETVACGLGVIHRGLFGLFDMVTGAPHRNIGHGARLLEGMLAWAKRNGAAYAYLQVVAANAPAVRLYEKLGYRRLYDYWYRKGGPAPGKPPAGQPPGAGAKSSSCIP